MEALELQCPLESRKTSTRLNKLCKLPVFFTQKRYPWLEKTCIQPMIKYNEQHPPCVCMHHLVDLCILCATIYLQILKMRRNLRAVLLTSTAIAVISGAMFIPDSSPKLQSETLGELTDQLARERFQEMLLDRRRSRDREATTHRKLLPDIERMAGPKAKAIYSLKSGEQEARV